MQNATRWLGLWLMAARVIRETTLAAITLVQLFRATF